MKKRFLVLIFFCFLGVAAYAQQPNMTPAQKADFLIKSLAKGVPIHYRATSAKDVYRYDTADTMYLVHFDSENLGLVNVARAENIFTDMNDSSRESVFAVQQLTSLFGFSPKLEFDKEDSTMYSAWYFQSFFVMYHTTLSGMEVDEKTRKISAYYHNTISAVLYD